MPTTNRGACHVDPIPSVGTLRLGLALGGEASSVIVGEANELKLEFVLQDAVLLVDIGDHVMLLAIDPGGERSAARGEGSSCSILDIRGLVSGCDRFLGLYTPQVHSCLRAITGISILARSGEGLLRVSPKDHPLVADVQAAARWVELSRYQVAHPPE